MRRTATTVLAALLAGLLTAPAAPAVTGFGSPAPVGAGGVRTPTAALTTGGESALAWDRGTRGVGVARRAPRGRWGSLETLGRGATDVRDPQVAVLATGVTVVAWSEVRGRSQRVVAAAAERHGRFGRAQVVGRVGSFTAAAPRLAVLGGRRLVLLWRDADPDGDRGALRLAFRASSGAFSRPVRAGEDGVFPAIVATRDDSAVAAWASADRTTPELRAATLAPGASRLGRPFTVSRSLNGGVRLAAGPEGSVLASWIARGREAVLLTARLAPRRSPAHRLAKLTGSLREPASLAVGPGGAALAAFRLFGAPDESPAVGYRQWAASGGAAAGFAAPSPLTGTGHAVVGAGRPAILASGEELVVWSQSRDRVGLAAYDVLVARRPPEAVAFAAAEVLGPGPATSDGAGVVLAQAGAQALVAWPSPLPAGGLLVAQRG